jgi:hypothetical protein
LTMPLSAIAPTTLAMALTTPATAPTTQLVDHSPATKEG